VSPPQLPVNRTPPPILLLFLAAILSPTFSRPPHSSKNIPGNFTLSFPGRSGNTFCVPFFSCTVLPEPTVSCGCSGYQELLCLHWYRTYRLVWLQRISGIALPALVSNIPSRVIAADIRNCSACTSTEHTVSCGCSGYQELLCLH